MTTVSERLATVRAQLEKAARECARPPQDITLVAVSKTHPPEAIREALDVGHRVFGENRVQEAEAKWPGLRADFPDVELHLIGPLQTNKVREAVALFDVIETVDREKLARRLAEEMAEQDLRRGVFLQVNTGKEPQKSGVFPEDLDDFVRLTRDDLGLDVRGLMAIPPQAEEPALHFALLRTLARRNGLAALSMGMSADYEIAVQLGASHIRVGTAIFGERPKL